MFLLRLVYLPYKEKVTAYSYPCNFSFEWQMWGCVWKLTFLTSSQRMLMFLVWELLLGIIDPVYKMKVEIIFQIFQMFVWCVRKRVCFDFGFIYRYVSLDKFLYFFFLMEDSCFTMLLVSALLWSESVIDIHISTPFYTSFLFGSL